ncbi:enoyl-CoA hydratase [Pseudopelagicola sp. nBUS_20]|uniref:enoyl-CoA hydratase n=1 Tax=Pseudopelagicola sp. nBUS_20 TaxID=3395317 RepID=UPI003EBDD8D4
MEIVERSDTSSVSTLTMNAPSRLNALSDEMLAALQSHFDALAGDQSIRAILIKGEGNAFCAGHDLKQMTQGRQSPDGGRAYFKDLFNRCAHMMQSIQKLPQPVIAQVHGIATAAGCQLVATCDMAIAAHGTRFGVNGVNIGLFCSTPMVALSRNIHRKKAFEMLSTGRFIETDEALAVGLINQAVSREQLDQCAIELARTVASKLAVAVKIGKQAFYQQLELPVEQAYRYTGDVMVENMLHRDTKEGIDAFLEKRNPDWTQ